MCTDTVLRTKLQNSLAIMTKEERSPSLWVGGLWSLNLSEHVSSSVRDTRPEGRSGFEFYLHDSFAVLTCSPIYSKGSSGSDILGLPPQVLFWPHCPTPVPFLNITLSVTGIPGLGSQSPSQVQCLYMTDFPVLTSLHFTPALLVVSWFQRISLSRSVP